MAGTWDSLAQSVGQDNSVTIGKVDCTQYRNLCNEFEVKGYPTLLWIKDGKKVCTSYVLVVWAFFYYFVIGWKIPRNENPRRSQSFYWAHEGRRWWGCRSKDCKFYAKLFNKITHVNRQKYRKRQLWLLLALLSSLWTQILKMELHQEWHLLNFMHLGKEDKWIFGIWPLVNKFFAFSGVVIVNGCLLR